MSKDCTIQDVFHRFYPSFESTHSISPAQRKAAYHIMNCKTGAFGVNVSVCEDCGSEKVSVENGFITLSKTSLRIHSGTRCLPCVTISNGLPIGT